MFFYVEDSHSFLFCFGRYSWVVSTFYSICEVQLVKRMTMCEVQLVKRMTAWLTKWMCREDSHVPKDSGPYSDPDEQEMVSNPSHRTAVLSDCCYHTSIHHHLEPLHQTVQTDLPLQYVFKLFEHCKDRCHSWRENKFNRETLKTQLISESTDFSHHVFWCEYCPTWNECWYRECEPRVWHGCLCAFLYLKTMQHIARTPTPQIWENPHEICGS